MSYSVLLGGGGVGGWQGEVTTVAVTSQLPFNSEARHPHLTSRNNVDWECV